MYYHACQQEIGYFFADTPEFVFDPSGIDYGRLNAYTTIMQTRPPKSDLPYAIRECGNVGFDFLLDFGSWRDVQRQRAVAQLMPLLTDAHGFEPWYLEQLPESLRLEGEQLLDLNQDATNNLDLDLTAQYYRPMGLRVSNRIVGDLRGCAYLVELRATSVVHPTLRRRAVQMGEALLGEFGSYGYTLHLEPDSDRFNIRRGEHDIVQRT